MVACLTRQDVFVSILALVLRPHPFVSALLHFGVKLLQSLHRAQNRADMQRLSNRPHRLGPKSPPHSLDTPFILY